MSKIVLFIIFSKFLYAASKNTSVTSKLKYISDDFSPNSTLDDDYPNSNCSNEYCLDDDDYLDLIIDHILPTPFEWILIIMHTVTFVVGLVGNALVCIAVYKNRGMRNVTNYFIVNLAVADFMVILFCLPPTVVWDVTETWFMGTLLCKIVLYFQIIGLLMMFLPSGTIKITGRSPPPEFWQSLTETQGTWTRILGDNAALIPELKDPGMLEGEISIGNNWVNFPLGLITIAVSGMALYGIFEDNDVKYIFPYLSWCTASFIIFLIMGLFSPMALVILGFFGALISLIFILYCLWVVYSFYALSKMKGGRYHRLQATNA